MLDCRAAALALAVAVTLAAPLCGQSQPESALASETLRLPPPPADPNTDVLSLPPATPHEAELLRLEEEAARIIAMEDGWVSSGDYTARTTACMTWVAGGGRRDFGTAEFDLSRTWFWQPGATAEPVSIAPGVGLHLWSGPATLDLPPRVYDLYLDVAWRFWNGEGWGMTGGLTPGFYGDFAHLDGNAFQLTGWVLGDWTLSDEWSLVAGAAYVRQFDSHLLPIGGAVWRPSDDMRLDIIFPRPRAAWRWLQTPERDVWLYLAGIFGGGAWSVDGGAGSSLLVQYSDLRLVGGVEIANFRGRITTLQAGYVFSRDISVESISLESPRPTILLQATLAY
jgi:hypothetical protein